MEKELTGDVCVENQTKLNIMRRKHCLLAYLFRQKRDKLTELVMFEQSASQRFLAYLPLLPTSSLTL